MASISREEIDTFHMIDRDIYTRLVISLHREPIHSIQVIALWLWLEQMGFENIILKMSSSPDSEINILYEEAIACLTCLGYVFLPMSSITDNIPRTQNLLGRGISLQFIRENRLQAFSGISKIINEVCIRAFSDIAQEAMSSQAAYNAQRNTITAGTGHENHFSSYPPPPSPSLGHNAGLHHHLVYQHPLIGNPPPAPLLRGASPQPRHFDFNGMNTGGSNHQVRNVETNNSSFGNHLNQQPQPIWDPNEEVFIPQEERTMFVTFSRGHPLRDWELRDFFNRMYGNCIEDIYMNKVTANGETLSGRIVFYLPSKITEILEGNANAKFIINGKHVRLGRYF